MTGTFGTTPDRSRREGNAGTRTQTSFLDDLRGGERDAFLLFYELYRTPIYNLALQLVGNETDAENLTPRVFIRAYHQILTHDGELALKPLIYRAAVTACLDHLARETDQPGVLPGAGRDTGPVWRLRRHEQNELSRRFSEALQALPGTHRAALLLKDVHDLRLDEVATILGMSMTVAEALLFRTREAFRHAFEEMSGGPRAARCRLAEQAVAGAGRALSGDEERKLRDHAEYCPDCRATVALWGSGKISLATFLKNAPLPAALNDAPVFHTPVGVGTPVGAGSPATAAVSTVSSPPAAMAMPAVSGSPAAAAIAAASDEPAIAGVPVVAGRPVSPRRPIVARGVPLKLTVGRDATTDGAAAVTSGTLIRLADSRRSAAAAARHMSTLLAKASDSLVGRVAVLAVVLTCVGAYVGFTTYVSQQSAGQGAWPPLPSSVHITINAPRVSSAAKPGTQAGKTVGRTATTPRAPVATTGSAGTASSGKTPATTTSNRVAVSQSGAPSADDGRPVATGSDGVQTAGSHDASHKTTSAIGTQSGGTVPGRVGSGHGGGHAGGKPRSDGGGGSGSGSGSGSGGAGTSWWQNGHSTGKPAQHHAHSAPARLVQTDGKTGRHSLTQPSKHQERSVRPLRSPGQKRDGWSQGSSHSRFGEQHSGQGHHERQQPAHDGGQGHHGSTHDQGSSDHWSDN